MNNERTKLIEGRLAELSERYPVLAPVCPDIMKAYEALRDCYDRGGKLLVAGNGGSPSDAQHIVGELMKEIKKKRPLGPELAAAIEQLDPVYGKETAGKLQLGLMALSLSEHQSLNTAFANDVDPAFCFAQQTLGYGTPGDVLMLISTSGNSKNLLYALPVAKALGMTVIGLTGRDGGCLAKEADIAIVAPEQETYKIQELHLPIYHTLCLMLEDTYFEI